jgi:predicted RNA-binding protein
MAGVAGPVGQGNWDNCQIQAGDWEDVADSIVVEDKTALVENKKFLAEGREIAQMEDREVVEDKEAVQAEDREAAVAACLAAGVAEGA